MGVGPRDLLLVRVGKASIRLVWLATLICTGTMIICTDRVGRWVSFKHR